MSEKRKRKRNKKELFLFGLFTLLIFLGGFFLGTLQPRVESKDKTENPHNPNNYQEILDKLEGLDVKLSEILQFIENQEKYNKQLRELLENLNTTHIDTVVYEIHNETLVEVDTVNIENATLITENVDIGEVNVDIDIDLYFKQRKHHCHWFWKCHKGEDD